MTSLSGDFRYVLRVLWRHRALNAVALLTLALAIGANTAIFSVVNALLLRPLPYPASDRLVQVVRPYPAAVGTYVSTPRFLFWKQHSGGALQGIAAYDGLGAPFNLTGGTPERLLGSRVTAAFFDTLGVQPALGRGFRDDEDRPGAAKVVVLEHGLWTRRFGARPEVVGETLTLNDEPYLVIGVMPDGFQFPAIASLWTLQQFDPGNRDVANLFEVIGRLRAGVRLAEAQAGLALVGEQFRRAEPSMMDKSESVGARPLQEALFGDMRPALLMLAAAVGFVLLIACVNVANLQLAQSTARQREIALRTALGADAWTIVRLLLLESLVLAAAGGLAGAALAYWAIPALVTLNPDGALRLEGVRLDTHVLLFACAVSLLAGVLSGMLPAWQSRRPDVEAVLRDSGTRATGGRTGALTRRALVAGEVALALMLAIGAAMLIKSLTGLHQRDPGFAEDSVLTMKLALPESKYGEVDALVRFEERLEARLRALPGVRAAALTGTLPLEKGPDMPSTIEGQYAEGSNAGVMDAQIRLVGRDFFDALRIPLRRGRLFDARDRRGTLPVVIINETAARRHWRDRSPLGQRISVGQPMKSDLAEAAPREIVGVVGDVREVGIGRDVPPVVYILFDQGNPALVRLFVRMVPLSVALRTDDAPDTLAQAAPRAVWDVDPNQPVTNVLTMREIVQRSLGPHRFNTLLLSLLAGLALVLAAVGIYGVLSHIVGQRTREVGVRMALGASRGRVLALFMRQGLGLVLTGAALGLAGAAAMTRLLRSLVVDVSAYDPWLFAIAPLVLLIVAAVAIGGPALRAARTDPARALRAE
jgi:predicted permease